MAAWMSASAASVAPLVRATIAARLKGLADENARLKRLLADAMLDRAIEALLVQAQWRGLHLRIF